ncbi:hypothetical protein H5407_19220 [Mitsuaria sp. WAJ17]|uniref:hypothetical protein n=1 Tax=Mitsuaria sp. WAJ17 TaxID=2761452 RepID=UPI0016003CC8|nr:hypothetical protein [Mitsuaria sp. WAJ17]MBB2487372.1 hypothetical protein [Mitsuaria sp. WAJ17]
MTVPAAPSTLLKRWTAWHERRGAARVRQQLQRRCPQALALQQRLPAGLHAAWLDHAAEEFPGLPSREADWLLASTGLMQFFLAAARCDGPCALPSRAADAVWHAWLRWDAAGLAAFQRERLGHEVPHLKEAQLPGPLDHALSRCYAACCRTEQLSPLDGQLPLVFELDRRLRMPAGWHYTWHKRLRCLSHQVLDIDGDPRGRSQLHAVHGASLLGLGLLTATEQLAWQHQLQRLDRQADARARGESGGSGSSCGSSCGADLGSASSDGGSSCGSSCGGGD